MTPARTFPNADLTKILHMRINPDGKVFQLHPEDFDLEHYLALHDGKATVKAKFLLARDRENTDGHSIRQYRPVCD